MCIYFLLGEIVGALTIDNTGSPVLQYQNNKYRTMITFQCNPEGQVGIDNVQYVCLLEAGVLAGVNVIAFLNHNVQILRDYQLSSNMIVL